MYYYCPNCLNFYPPYYIYSTAPYPILHSTHFCHKCYYNPLYMNNNPDCRYCLQRPYYYHL